MLTSFLRWNSHGENQDYTLLRFILYKEFLSNVSHSLIGNYFKVKLTNINKLNEGQKWKVIFYSKIRNIVIYCKIEPFGCK